MPAQVCRGKAFDSIKAWQDDHLCWLREQGCPEWFIAHQATIFERDRPLIERDILISAGEAQLH